MGAHRCHCWGRVLDRDAHAALLKVLRAGPARRGAGATRRAAASIRGALALAECQLAKHVTATLTRTVWTKVQVHALTTGGTI